MQDDRHIATLLGFSAVIKGDESLSESQTDSGERSNCKFADVLLKTLLKNLSFQVVRDALEFILLQLNFPV